MPRLADLRMRGLAPAVLALLWAVAPQAVAAEPIAALPDRTSHIRLSNRDVNHIVCSGGEIGDVRFSAEKGLVVERGGADAWVKFLVKETEDMGSVARTYVTTPSEFFISCNGAIYPLYAEPSDMPAQTVLLLPGASQRAQANEALLGPLVEEERAVSITLALLQDRVPASFSEVALVKGIIVLGALPGTALTERRRLSIDGMGLSATEYRLSATTPILLDERIFLDRQLGSDIFAITLDRLDLQAGATARLIVIRRGAAR